VLADGDRLVGFIQPGESDTVIYLFHGLGGSIDSGYMHRTARLALKRGHGVMLFNHRGCGEGQGLSKYPYHSGRAEDLSAVIEYGKKLFPFKRHIAVGFSLSGNALLLLMTGRRGSTQPDAALSVNAPIHLQRTAQSLGEGFNRVYDAKFYLQCREDVLKSQADRKFKKSLPPLTTLREFDNLYTAPAGGFADREDYYSSCST
jgi:predicted alpha/beta-fold hydrolase